MRGTISKGQFTFYFGMDIVTNKISMVIFIGYVSGASA